MIDAFGLRAAIETDVVHALRQVRKVFTDLHPVPRADEVERAGYVVTLARLHRRDAPVALSDELLHVQLAQLRLWIEGVNVAGPTVHQQKGARLCFGGKVRLLGRERIGRLRGRISARLCAEQRRERDAAEAIGGVEKKVAAGRGKLAPLPHLRLSFVRLLNRGYLMRERIKFWAFVIPVTDLSAVCNSPRSAKTRRAGRRAGPHARSSNSTLHSACYPSR